MDKKRINEVTDDIEKIQNVLKAIKEKELRYEATIEPALLEYCLLCGLARLGSKLKELASE